MQYGLSLPNGGPWSDARTLAELAQLAEDSGWNGVFLEDYIVWQSNQSVPTYDPWVALAAIDHLSNGRLILGVGLGDTGESVGSDISLTHFNEMKNAKEAVPHNLLLT